MSGGNGPWVKQGGGGGSAVDTIGPVGAAPNANAGVIAGTTLTLEPADSTNPGLVTAGTQTLAGAKTFSSLLTGSAGGTFTGGNLSVGGGNDLAFAVTGSHITSPGSLLMVVAQSVNQPNAFRINANVTHFNVDSNSAINNTSLPAPVRLTRYISQNATTPVAVGAHTTAVVGDCFTNFVNTKGATAVVFNLATATLGDNYTFVVEDSGGFIVNAATGDSFRYVTTAGVATTGATAGSITSTIQGAVVEVVCHKLLFWSVRALAGTIGSAATNIVVA